MLWPHDLVSHVSSWMLSVLHFFANQFTVTGSQFYLKMCPPFVSLLVSEHFYSFVSQVCHCWCPPFSGDHAAFLVVCPPNLSLVVSALFRWSCGISMHLSPRSVTAGVRPFRRPCSISIRLSPRSVTAAVRPFPLAM